MPKTHHATRKFRLGCGCLRDYPGMAVGKRHDVLCASCGAITTTLYAYPERACGADGTVTAPAGGLIRVSCTRDHGNKDCKTGVHYDEFNKANFAGPGPLRQGEWGNTGRA